MKEANVVPKKIMDEIMSTQEIRHLKLWHYFRGHKFTWKMNWEYEKCVYKFYSCSCGTLNFQVFTKLSKGITDLL